ncbi:uncharacterized protein A4U43_C06F3950 [Asparagus officinalis]|uniref:Uncharacterized protein n=1 Tax=Asparagus officinalis TaxID=4686 RepID=A0A5P1EPW5_ASPOF|nr:uncharacterized protein A4U43_C06F3950 [Asparagus officinalis]
MNRRELVHKTRERVSANIFRALNATPKKRRLRAKIGHPVTPVVPSPPKASRHVRAAGHELTGGRLSDLASGPRAIAHRLSPRARGTDLTALGESRVLLRAMPHPPRSGSSDEFIAAATNLKLLEKLSAGCRAVFGRDQGASSLASRLDGLEQRRKIPAVVVRARGFSHVAGCISSIRPAAGRIGGLDSRFGAVSWSLRGFGSSFGLGIAASLALTLADIFDI